MDVWGRWHNRKDKDSWRRREGNEPGNEYWPQHERSPLPRPQAVDADVQEDNAGIPVAHQEKEHRDATKKLLLVWARCHHRQARWLNSNGADDGRVALSLIR